MVSGHRTGGRAAVSRSRRRLLLAPPLTPAPSLPHSRLRTPAGHAHWPAPAGHARWLSSLRPAPLGRAPGLHGYPLPTEYEQQPAPVPSMEKKRTVYQMALSKMVQPRSPRCPRVPHAKVSCLATTALFVPAHPSATSALRTLVLHPCHNLTSSFLLPALHLAPWRSPHPFLSLGPVC